MKQTLRLGRVAGIPVGAHWSVVVITALIAGVLGASVLPVTAPGNPAAVYWLVAVPAAVVFLVSLLAHELAHALVARRRGIRVRSITLWMLGGAAELEDEPPSPRADLQIALAGPLTSVAAGAVFLAVAWGAYAVGAPAIVTAALAWTGLMNALLGVFNLLPGAPLDGGRVLRAVLWRVHGDRVRAARTATLAGRATGGVLIGVGVLELVATRRLDGVWLMLIGWFLVQAAGAEQRATVVRGVAAGAVARDVMTPRPEVAAAWHSVRSFAAVAARSRQAVFPVVGFGGDPVGVVTLEVLARLPAQRTDDRIDAVAVPLAPEHTVDPETPLTSLVQRPPLAGALVAVVVEGGVLVGMITVDDMRRFVQLRQLQRLATPAPVPA